ncbi:hypothetical protein EV384_4441 [Micromonospora kangleipakensis]|uniref:Uncharacterized protein n=1 Tax=Micromonospora kangleipakensis TaxID=1077942 RepID=A0A4Q8BFD5_9ACTN|nr:hypothetical protein [Micromonospora kangleipakensis]RZU75869.1 hypothetical protein EV384_4441 [Micromonospora kangleipakensis]
MSLQQIGPADNRTCAAVEEQRTERRRTALKLAGSRARAATLASTAALAEIGELLRQDQSAGDPIGIGGAEVLTGLTRPTLTDARDDPAHWHKLCGLAKRVVEAEDDDAARVDLHARLPHLAGWYHAAQHLQRVHKRAYWAGRGSVDPAAPLHPECDAPGYDALMSVYEAAIARLAAGAPGPGENL